MPTTRKKPTAQARKKTGPRLRTQIRVMLDEEIAMGPGKADLLEAIRETGSISAAGKQMGMSYRRAWLLADTMNRCFREPLIQTAKGGSHGGGAQLTTLGEEVLATYRAMQADAEEAAARHFQSLQPCLRKKPLPSTDA